MGESPQTLFEAAAMYRIELARGEETVFRTIEELATAIRNGVVTIRARIYHNASQKWLPIEFHPHYKKALELSSSSSHPVDPAPSRTAALRTSGPRATVAPAQPAPVEHHPAPVQHHPAPVQHHPAPIQFHLAPVLIPPPVPSPVLELTRPSFTQPSSAAPEVVLALEEPPQPPPPFPAGHEEPAPSAAQRSRSWMRRPIQLAVIGIIAIVSTRVVVSAAAPGSENRPLAEAAPRPTPPPTTTAPRASASDEAEPGAVLTAGPAFSPGIMTSADAPKSSPPAPMPPRRPATVTTAAADSIQAAIEPAPTTGDLAPPALPTSDSLAPAPVSRDSSAIGRILRAVTSTKPIPNKAAAQ